MSTEPDLTMRPPEDGGVRLDVTGYGLLRQYQSAGQTIEMWKKFRDEVKAQILAVLGAHPYGHFGGRRVLSVGRTRPRRFDVKAFAADHPGLHAQYLREADEDEVRLYLHGMPTEEQPAEVTWRAA